MSFDSLDSNQETNRLSPPLPPPPPSSSSPPLRYSDRLFVTDPPSNTKENITTESNPSGRYSGLLLKPIKERTTREKKWNRTCQEALYATTLWATTCMEENDVEEETTKKQFHSQRFKHNKGFKEKKHLLRRVTNPLTRWTHHHHHHPSHSAHSLCKSIRIPPSMPHRTLDAKGLSSNASFNLMDWSSLGNLLAIALKSYCYIHNTITGQTQHVLSCGSICTGVAWSRPRGDWLACLTSQHQLQLLSGETLRSNGIESKKRRTSTNVVLMDEFILNATSGSLAWSPRHGVLALGDGNYLKLLTVMTQQEGRDENSNQRFESSTFSPPLRAQWRCIVCLGISSIISTVCWDKTQGDLIAIGTNKGEIIVYQFDIKSLHIQFYWKFTQEEEEEEEEERYSETTTTSSNSKELSIAFSPLIKSHSPPSVLLVTHHFHLRFFSKNGQLLQQCEDSLRSVIHRIVWKPTGDGFALAHGNPTNHLSIWSWPSLQERIHLFHTDAITQLILSNQHLYTAAVNGCIGVWDWTETIEEDNRNKTTKGLETDDLIR